MARTVGLKAEPFQPALPMRGVTTLGVLMIYTDEFQPALPMRGVTSQHGYIARGVCISTRTPHAGSDPRSGSTAKGCTDFNPHSPCGE